MQTLFLSDLHLPDEPSTLREGFRRFLAGPARRASAVYILGDLFEYWIGDDVGMQAYAEEIAALKALTASGIAVYFMHGNRDFLVGRDFAAATGVQLLRDPLMLDLYGRRTLLSHGDLWCTDDIGYQRWRSFSRNRFAQWVFSMLPVSRRQKIAGGVRGQSASAKRNKAESIMDVNTAAVDKAFQSRRVDRIIHGHTHRPATHSGQLQGRNVERIVLADWHDDRMEYLAVDEAGPQRVALNP
ncbi:MAG: UDP-2,3-diacylglucosamine diphosphatase [Pseudomonadota bacterium]|nr:UDP-2,3-diacylglucosamine diphosphatase [Pseudomonadota bacterium]